MKKKIQYSHPLGLHAPVQKGHGKVGNPHRPQEKGQQGRGEEVQGGKAGEDGEEGGEGGGGATLLEE